ncbi:hypothetical protein CONPUDRAFT_103737 [Coniophora puteana RWD-64-598 SS2]|uniref:Secreted protein n=1 Tax=Coniophora puteana (strain RWD-64-598) TaxID=741705 RepID=A0A5M3MTL0_CONPW|nr:uncharacterized protein CONPUDRAFT_103737 [Coniophora puteana RWD-64-598 SS2]EIW82498.1 hypothetical protein CONPUDRAFT_103737 [Coniophora puteana RWD-64-598 SS2]
MFPLFAVTFLTAIILLCLFSPTVRRSIIAGDDTLDAHESGLALVASRNPFRETGPPVCMAKLIMLRHKMQTSTRKRKSPAQPRHPRSFVAQPTRSRQRDTWVRFGRIGNQYH